MKSLSYKHRRQAGLSMIEVLITLIIVSFGMLGIAGMLLRGLNSGNIANLKSIAVLQANEMADRMRANLDGLRSGSYNTLNYTPVTSCASTCLTGKCSSAEHAALDFCMWNAQNQKMLPLGRGTVTLRADLGGGCATSQFFCSYDIIVSWDEGKTGDSSSLKQYTLRIEP